jgi:electron transport complex protein RnfD
MKELKMFNQPAPMDTSQLDLAVGPHCRMSSGLAEIYQLWVIALTPAMAASLFIMGPASLRVFGLCVCFSVIIDFICEKLAPSRDLTSNWSSVSLALLLAFMLPLNAPWWFILIGCLIMIVVGKKFFGGVGAYPVQPAVLSVAVLQLSWPDRMDYTAAMKDMDWSVTMIEPLRLAKSMGAQVVDYYNWYELFFGIQVAGTANGMVFFILVSGLLLLLMQQIQWQAPAGFVVGLMVTGGLLHQVDPSAFAPPLFYLLSGGTVFMALFLITDHTNSPVNKTPLFIYGLIAGILLVLIRGYSKHVDGIAYAVLLVNLCAPLLDMIRPKTIGAGNV